MVRVLYLSRLLISVIIVSCVVVVLFFVRVVLCLLFVAVYVRISSRVFVRSLRDPDRRRAGYMVPSEL